MQSERSQLEGRIQRLLATIPDVQDDELRAELTKHLCVLSSGLLEVSCRDILNRYISRRAAPEVRRFVSTRLLEFQSAKVRNVVDLLQAFDPHQADKWRSSLSDEQADSIDSIVNNRHQIAHGRSIGLSFSVFLRYHQSAGYAVDLLERQFPPS
jgi:hypothetical protein